MPCLGIAVANLKRRKAAQRDNMIDRVREMLRDNQINYIADGTRNKNIDVVKFQLDTSPPMNLALGPGDSITIISVDGSFEDGKTSIEDLIEKIQALDESVELDGEIETHIHEGEGDAPQQAYAESSVGQ